MKLVMLHRQAPVAPGASQCRLCDAGIEGTFQDHLLVGQPGTAQLTAALHAVRRGPEPPGGASRSGF